MVGLKASLWALAAIVAVAVLHFTFSQPLLQWLVTNRDDALGAYAWTTYHLVNILSAALWVVLAALVLSALYVLLGRAVRQ